MRILPAIAAIAMASSLAACTSRTTYVERPAPTVVQQAPPTTVIQQPPAFIVR